MRSDNRELRTCKWCLFCFAIAVHLCTSTRPHQFLPGPAEKMALARQLWFVHQRLLIWWDFFLLDCTSSRFCMNRPQWSKWTGLLFTHWRCTFHLLGTLNHTSAAKLKRPYLFRLGHSSSLQSWSWWKMVQAEQTWTIFHQNNKSAYQRPGRAATHARERNVRKCSYLFLIGKWSWSDKWHIIWQVSQWCMDHFRRRSDPNQRHHKAVGCRTPLGPTVCEQWRRQPLTHYGSQDVASRLEANTTNLPCLSFCPSCSMKTFFFLCWQSFSLIRTKNFLDISLVADVETTCGNTSITKDTAKGKH